MKIENNMRACQLLSATCFPKFTLLFCFPLSLFELQAASSVDVFRSILDVVQMSDSWLGMIGRKPSNVQEQQHKTCLLVTVLGNVNL